MRRRFHPSMPARLLALVALAAVPVLLSAPAFAQMADAAAAIDTDATAALDRMGAYLRTLEAFQVEATTQREEVLENGLKAQFQAVTSFLAQKPNRLRIETTSDRHERQYLYDGKQFTLYAKRAGYYATVPAPATTRELLDVLADKYGIEIPLADLFLWGAAGRGSTGITAAVDLGPSTVGGVTCQHYAFRQEGLDWQIWIQLGDFPLPHKLVLTTTTDEARPQFQATYAWNLAPSFNAEAFTFTAPADANRIVLEENAPAAGAGN